MTAATAPEHQRLRRIRTLVDRVSRGGSTNDPAAFKALMLLWLGHPAMLLLLHIVDLLARGGGLLTVHRIGAGLIRHFPPHLRASAVFLTSYGRWKAGARPAMLDDLGLGKSPSVVLAGSFFEFMTTGRLKNPQIGLLGDFRFAIEFVRATLPVLRNAGLSGDADRLEFFWGVIEHRLRSAEPILVLSPGYLLNVGHCVVTAALIETQRAGGFAPQRTAALLGKTHNPFLRDLVTAPMVAPPDQGYRFGEVVDGSKTFVLKDGRRAHVMALLSDAGRVWSAGGRPFATLDPAVIERGYRALERYGIGPGDRLVTFHVREPGFHADTEAARHNDAEYYGMRNAPVADYREAIEQVIAGGATVVRLGDPAMTPLGDRPGFIDYPHSELKSDWMDVFLVSQCHYHIGTPSGMSFVPMLFGRPIVFTNWISLVNVIDTPNVLTLFKPLRDADGRLVPFADFASRYRCLANDKELEFHGVRHDPNEPADIVEAVMLMDRHADRASGRLDLPDELFADCGAQFGRSPIGRRPKVPPGFWNRLYGSGRAAG